MYVVWYIYFFFKVTTISNWQLQMRKIHSKSRSLWHLPPFGEATRSSGFWRPRRSLWNGRFPSSLRRVQKLKRHRKSGNSGKLLHPMITIRTIQMWLFVHGSTVQVSWSLITSIILIWESERESCLVLSLGPSSSLHDVLGWVWITRKIRTRQERRLSYEGENRFWRRLGGFLGFLGMMEPSKF